MALEKLRFFYMIMNTVKNISQKMFFMSQETILPQKLTMKESFQLILSIHNKKTTVHSVVSTWDDISQKRYNTIKDRLTCRCSVGEKKWFFLKSVLSLNMDFYLLDEPTAGVDAETRILIWQDIVARKKEGKTFLVSSHLLDEIAKHTDTLNIIKDKGIKHFSSPQVFIKKYKEQTLDEAFLKFVQGKMQNI